MKRSAITPASVSILALALAFARGGAEPVEPPTAGADASEVAYETADSLALDAVEVGFGADGQGSRLSRRRRRVRLKDGALDADVRSGENDPVAGAALRAAGLGGRLALGRVRPRWGCGLVLGAPREPWRSQLGVAGTELDHDALRTLESRAVSGEGLRWSREGGRSYEAIGARIARREVAGVRGSWGPLAIGGVGDRGRSRRLSIATESRAHAAELALDRVGSWRGAIQLERTAAHRVARLGFLAGHREFDAATTLGVRGPSRAVTFELLTRSRVLAWRGLLSAWSFGGERAGSRMALELAPVLPHASTLSIGFEEQRGTRRDRSDDDAWRQAGWGEWWSAPGPLRLAIRSEVWGARPFARALTRSLSSVRIEARPGAGLEVALAHSAYRTTRGDRVWLPESDTDRLVLRSRAGSGRRTRLEVGAPGFGGRLRASLALDETARHTQPHWSLDWTGTRRTPSASRDP
ncbi:MAG: hypothetical protein HOP12_09785 [Candidatus Eisenbacteria bacterium]|uniref:Capsule assembly Wzi family protein n=1 Tax=Eiseniibacteriota bacterium TaxID=2212470 RepID=A0A849SNL5_UNCEI|nr:hypothetical protein [Candidatus Eisenbacteria bacterium]